MLALNKQCSITENHFVEMHEFLFFPMPCIGCDCIFQTTHNDNSLVVSMIKGTILVHLYIQYKPHLHKYLFFFMPAFGIEKNINNIRDGPN
jgi:hypothetical protein